jgi:hypothetical protein
MRFNQLRTAVVRSEKLAAETGIIRKPRGGGTSTVRNRYQATANED